MPSILRRGPKYIRYYKIQSSENNQLQNAFVFQMKRNQQLRMLQFKMKQVQSYIHKNKNLLPLNTALICINKSNL